MSPVPRPGEPDHQRGTAPTAWYPGRLAGQVALVTGAGSGIGRATARRMAAEGAAVACLDVVAENVEAVADEINEAAQDAQGEGAAQRALALCCDVTDEASVGRAVAEARTGLGRPTVVCNIAGIGRFAHTTELSLEEWERVIAVNLTGTFIVCRATLPLLLDGGGAILNTSSTAGKMGQPYSAAYCASKGGVSLLTRALAVEFADRGVRVNAVAPGGVDTPIIWDFGFPEGANMKALDRLTSPMGFASPAEVAGLFAYLASDEAAYVTGAVLSVDGGITA